MQLVWLLALDVCWGRKRFRNTYSVFLLFVCGLLLSCYQPPSNLKNGPRFRSYSNLYRIGLAIREYEHDNGGLPERLSQLLPKYIPCDSVNIFYQDEPKSGGASILSKDLDNVDKHSVYKYIGINGGTILAHEKVGFWPP